MTNPDLGSWLNRKVALLRGKTELPTIEVNAIASHVLDKPIEWIISHPEESLDRNQLEKLEESVDRLIAGEPLAYITGKRSFFGLDFFVDNRVLIPRPETELLVELAIVWLEGHPAMNRVVDVGTGSGVIAIVIADNFRTLHITAVDISPDALEVARSNAALHQVSDRIKFIRADLLEGIDKKFDLILANLPYIPSKMLGNLEGLKFEPRIALDGGINGLVQITDIIDNCSKLVTSKGCIILEIQYNQGDAVREIAAKQFPQAIITIHNDLASLPRVVKIQL
ncbi:MAG: peptide chain release factor N(5)-glutamine methyltransferase [Anaerolineaceae bacterium]